MGNSGDDLLGRIAWTAVECRSGRVLGSGERLVTSQDFRVERLPSKKDRNPQMSKSIALDEKFILGYSASLAHPGEKIRGFGLTGGHSGERTFSWDWFCVTESGEAAKIQEGGQLGFEIIEREEWLDVCRIEFQSAVSIRILPFGLAMLTLKPRWRINIEQGSWITWPHGAPWAK